MLEMQLVFLIFLLLFVSVDGLRLELSSQKWTFTGKNLSGVTKVPGDIFSDLHSNGLIENPYYADNDIKLRWVSRVDWTYETSLNMSDDILNSTFLFLELDGIDGVSEISLDGKLIGNTNNQFRTYTFNVTSLIKQSSTLKFKFPSIVKYANRQFNDYKRKYGVEIPPLCPPEVQEGECHVNFVRKTQSSFSWDWGPAFPTIGIYKPINLIHFQSFHLQQISPLVVYENNEFAIHLKVSYRCNGLSSNSYNFLVGIAELNLLFRVKSKVGCNYGKLQQFEHHLTVSNVKLELWYPIGYGNAKLYRLQAIANYQVNNTWKKESLFKNIGFRQVQLNTELVNTQNSTFGRNFAFSVNSIPIFLKGVNYIPESVFPSNFPLSKLEFLFYSLTQANMNTIRVWGGGEWPKDEFFDLADRYGVMVFHDLMFACALYPSNDDFLENIEQEINEQILRTRNHPSILIYSGNNELEVGIQAKWWFALNYTDQYMIQDYTKLMKTAINAVKKANPSALVIRSSPSNADPNVNIDLKPNDPAYGDVHFYNEMINLWKPENLIIPRCATEFGVPSFPLRSTMINYIPESEWSYTSRLINLRNHHLFGTATLPLMISQHFSIPSKGSGIIDMTNFAYISQIHQAIAVRTQTEHYRRYRSILNDSGLGNTMCALYWQLNDVWAAPTWSSIDFDQRWKAAQYHAKHMFAPVLISMYIDTTQTLQLYIVSDLVNTITNAKLRLRMMSLHDNFNPMFEQNFTISVPSLASTKIDYLVLGHPYDQDFFFKSELYSEDGIVIAEGFLPLEKLYNDAVFGTCYLKSLKRVNGSFYEITIQATDVVPYIWLDLNMTQIVNNDEKNKNLLYHFSDNAFYITETLTKITLSLTNSNTTNLTLKDITLCWIYNC